MATKALSTNRGLTVRINLWALDSDPNANAEYAKIALWGQATNEHTGEVKKFNEPGDLLTTLGKWNAAQLKALRAVKNAD